MKNRYKPHLLKLMRKRTSLGRDLDKGLCLDRNERVMPFSDHIINDIYRHIPKHAFSAYPDTDSLYARLAAWLNIPQERVYIINGITEGIRIVFETLISPGDRVVTISPTFPMYEIYAEIYQARLHNVEYKEDLSLDIKGLYDAINNDTCLVCLPNPNLPIESILKLDEIRRLADKCKKCGAILVVDEAYCFFGAASAVCLVEEYDNLVVFQTFSKAFGLAGIRLGYIVSNEENIEYLAKTRSLVESNGFSMAIGEYMLEHVEVMNKYSREVREGAEYVKNQIQNLGFRCFGGNVTNGLLIFLRSKTDTENLINSLKNSKIYVRGSFGHPIENCVRLTIGPKEAMKKFISAFSKWAKVSSVK